MTALPTRPSTGFTLLELAISLLIIGLLSSGLLAGISSQRLINETQTADRQLELIRETLYGFALVNGRLPCPAHPTLNSSDAAAGQEDCSLQHGVVPWVTLAMQENDPWGKRFTYYASDRFTTLPAAGSHAGFTLDTVGNANILDGSGKTIAADLPAIIVCHGRNGAGAYTPLGLRQAGASGEEAENADADLSFIKHTPGPLFDDQVIWINPAILKARLVAAGKLP